MNRYEITGYLYIPNETPDLLTIIAEAKSNIVNFFDESTISKVELRDTEAAIDFTVTVNSDNKEKAIETMLHRLEKYDVDNYAIKN